MIGTQIGNYRIVEKLGEGGMGVVYKGVDIGLDRVVAIKVLSSELSRSPELVERFRAEARAQANLNHFNLATLYTFLVSEGTAVMVMEFVDGETFGQMIGRRSPIPAQDAMPLFKQALLGIGTAHRMGIVHRDIKPSNLMLNKNGIVKVMDFGIAKVMGTRGMTRTGTQMGTVAYMSPEQIQNRPVDIRSDIYALGVTLYEMLSGRLPFEADSDFQIMHDHVHTPPPSPRRFYPYIPEGIENVVFKALAKQPDLRFQTVEEFGAALDHPERVLSFAPSPAADAPAGLRPTVVEGGGSRTPAPASVAPVPPQVMTHPTGPGAYNSPTASGTVAGDPTQPYATAAGAPPTEPPSASLPVASAFWNSRNKAVVIVAATAVVLLLGWALVRRPTPVGGGGGGGSGSSAGMASQGGLTPPPSGPTEHTIPGSPAASAPDGSAPDAGSTPTASATPATPAPPASVFAVPFNQLRIKRRVAATYPAAAVSQGIVNGTVLVDAEIDESGRVLKIAPRSGNSMLYAAATSAAETWRFEPYEQNGQAVKVTTQFEVPFQPVQVAQQQPPPPPQKQQQAAAPVVEAPPVQQQYPQQAQQQQTPPPQAPAPVVQQPPQSQQAYGGNFVTRAVHRHLLGNGQYSACGGTLLITPAGMLSYSCDTPDRVPNAMGGNCHQFSFPLSEVKKANVAPEFFNGQQYGHLHLEQGWAKKWDLYVPGNMADTLSSLVSGTRR